jgi:hypothetical protein
MRTHARIAPGRGPVSHERLIASAATCGDFRTRPLDGCCNWSRVATPPEVGGVPRLFPPPTGGAPFSHPIAPALRGSAPRASQTVVVCAGNYEVGRGNLALSVGNLARCGRRVTQPHRFRLRPDVAESAVGPAAASPRAGEARAVSSPGSLWLSGRCRDDGGAAPSRSRSPRPSGVGRWRSSSGGRSL